MFNTAKIIDGGPSARPEYRFSVYVGTDEKTRYVLSCATADFARRFIVDEYPNVHSIHEVAR